MFDIVITEFMDEVAVNRLKQHFTALYDPTLVDRPDEIATAISQAQALIVRNSTQVDATLIAAAPQLKCIGRLGVGLDNINLPACEARSVTVYPAIGANNIAVAEYVITTAMLLLRRAYHATQDVIAGFWPRQTLIGHEIFGKTIGLVGLGAIACEVAQRAEALGMPVIAYDPYLSADHPAWKSISRLPLDTLLAQADIVSLHVPLTATTQHIIDAGALACMKPGAVLINAARGGIVDETALCAALRQERIAGAALDVFEHEPLSAEHGAIFQDIANLLLTPHIAGVTEESNIRVSNKIADLVLGHLEATA